MTTLELIFATQRVISVSGDAEKKPLWGFGGPLPAVSKPKVKGVPGMAQKKAAKKAPAKKGGKKK
jgi:hypothetical protein